MPKAELVMLRETAPEKPVRLFIHGYKAINARSKLKTLGDAILNSGWEGAAYLLYWRSGRWAPTFAVTALRFLPAVFRVSKLLSPAWVVGRALGAVGFEAVQFARQQKRSEAVGRYLQEIIEEIPQIKSRRLSLIGHSLGARAIHYALAELDWSEYQLQDAVLLAGAADLEAGDWPECIGKLGGRLFNCYSKADHVLQITPDQKRRVGRHPLPAVEVDGENKVVNIECPGFGHQSYWRRLDEVCRKVEARRDAGAVENAGDAEAERSGAPRE